MSKSSALAERAVTIQEQAKELAKVATPEQRTVAVAHIKGIKALEKEINEYHDPNIKRWHEGHKEAIAQKKAAVAPLNAAERILKKGVASYDSAQKRAAEAARRAAEEEARAAAEAKREAEAEALAAEGNEDLAEMVSQMPVTVTVTKEAVLEPENDGTHLRTNTVVEIIDKKAVVEYVLEHWDLFNHWIEIPLKNPRQLAQQQKDAFNIPGIKRTVEESLQVRG